MIKYYDDDNKSGRKFIFIITNKVKFSFSIVYGMRGKGRKGRGVDDILSDSWKSKLEDVNNLSSKEKRICVKEMFNNWYYE